MVNAMNLYRVLLSLLCDFMIRYLSWYLFMKEIYHEIHLTINYGTLFTIEIYDEIHQTIMASLLRWTHTIRWDRCKVINVDIQITWRDFKG